MLRRLRPRPGASALFIRHPAIRNLATPARPGPVPTMKITPIPMFSDNYAYLVTDEATKQSAIVDPAEPKSVYPVLKSKIDSGEIELTSIVTTHHHADHAGGNREMVAKFPPGLTVYGGKDCAMTNHFVQHREEFTVGEIKVTGLHTPCHTRDSVCYFFEHGDSRAVFTGDTLFNAGCGRFFEGTAEQMHVSLNKTLGALPADTKVYPGHEYTLANALFAESVSSSPAIQSLIQYCLQNKTTTGKFTIAEEKTWNVFMMLDDPEIQTATGESDPVQVMRRLRELKNSFSVHWVLNVGLVSWTYDSLVRLVLYLRWVKLMFNARL